MIALALLLDAQDVLAPLDYWVGHCWRTTLATDTIDTHCFTRTDTGVRDHHEVSVQGAKVYQGDTDYRADGTRIRFAYRNDKGPVSDGMVTPTAQGLDFGESRWVRTPGGYATITGEQRREFVRVR